MINWIKGMIFLIRQYRKQKKLKNAVKTIKEWIE